MPDLTMTLSDEIDAALQKNWYYVAELRDGELTKGTRFKNIAVTRRVLDAIDVKGAASLDVSTMEGMFSVLLTKRGANVLATDTIDNRDRLSVLSKVHECRFDYYPHAPVENYVENVLNHQASRAFRPTNKIELGKHSPYGFDLVLSSGVIYHVHNPVQHIVNYRRLCKSGGLVVLESAALLSDEIEMVHDWWGGDQTWNGNATWYPSTRALEVFLRAAFFEPIGYSYIHVSGKTEHKLCRIAIVARAVDERPFSESDEAVVGSSELYKNYDFKPIHPSARLTGESRLDLAVDLSKISEGGNLRASKILETPAQAFDEDYLTLKLGDR
ncbi:MAG: class I SAM-dependent methyltransferase [Hyphomonas sp.]|nr:class I SAM-dependent methyltransferase [Hyphomonas sp.]